MQKIITAEKKSYIVLTVMLLVMLAALFLRPVSVQAAGGMTMAVGETRTLGNGSWHTSDFRIAAVNAKNGTVYAQKPGTVTLEDSDSGHKYSLTVVRPSMPMKSLSMTVGQVYAIALNNAQGLDVTWESGNIGVAVAADGQIIAAGTGATRISAYIANKRYSCMVYVTDGADSISGGYDPDDAPVNTIRDIFRYISAGSTDNRYLTLERGQSYNIHVDGNEGAAVWHSSDRKTALVDEYGTIWPKNAGKTTVYAVINGVRIKVHLTVKDSVYSAAGHVHDYNNSFMRLIPASDGHKGYCVHICSCGKYVVTPDDGMKQIAVSDNAAPAENKVSEESAPANKISDNKVSDNTVSQCLAEQIAADIEDNAAENMTDEASAVSEPAVQTPAPETASAASSQTVPAPAAGQTISVLGDSLSAYAGLIPSNYYYSYQQHMAAGEFPSTNMWWSILCANRGWTLNTLNACGGSGVVDFNYLGFQADSDRVKACGAAPARIFVLIGANDAIAGIDMGYLEQHYEDMLTRLKAAYPAAMIECCTYPYLPAVAGERMDSLNNAIRTAAADTGCMLLDTAKYNIPSEQYYADCIHWNADGQASFAGAVIQLAR